MFGAFMPLLQEAAPPFSAERNKGVGYLQVVVLYVEMEESVRRQMLRATMAAQHNKRAADAGSEDIWNVRTTDVDDKKCRRRYEVFRVSKLRAAHTGNSF